MNYDEMKKKNTEILLAKLKDLGVTRAEVLYSGGGDSGDFTDPCLFTSEGPCDDPIFKQIVVQYSRYFNESWEIGEKDVGLEEAFMDYAESILERHHPGWEINEGSNGTMNFSFEEMKVTIDHTYHEPVSDWDTYAL
jgi:hypothetical protein